MRMIKTLVIVGSAMLLVACATITADMASFPAANAQVKPQVSAAGKENAGAESSPRVARRISVCPVTRPMEPLFVPPAPYPAVAPYGDFWFGTEKLWTSLSPSGKWQALPNDGSGFSQKIFWWRNDASSKTEPSPDLQVTGRRLDGEGTFTGMAATSAFHDDFGGWAMLTGVEIPSAGCWEITGRYVGERLSFVVEVGE